MTRLMSVNLMILVSINYPQSPLLSVTPGIVDGFNYPQSPLLSVTPGIVDGFRVICNSNHDPKDIKTTML